MGMIRSFTVGNGDMFYIKHNSDNFTIIDCQLFGDHKEWLVEELIQESKDKGIKRFISTHPDEDHLLGIEHLDAKMPIQKFHVVKTDANKPNETESFLYYKKPRDGEKAFYVHKGCTRKWINVGDDKRDTSRLSFQWPDLDNKDFQEALRASTDGKAFNNTSLVVRYSINNGPSFLWLGDLETGFMEKIFDHIELPETTIVFAPHHRGDSGKLPGKWLEKLKQKIIVIGEAPSRHLTYYQGYKNIMQNKAGDMTFIPDGRKTHCYASWDTYGKRDWLTDEGRPNEDFGVRDLDYYIGTLNF